MYCVCFHFKVLVLGGGVAGLAAVQAAKNMGAIVKAFDVRPAVKEQIESLGGEFLEVEFQVSFQSKRGVTTQRARKGWRAGGGDI